MHYRRLGHSGLKVPALSFGTATFGGRGEFFSAWGASDADGARRLVDVCVDHGVTLFDTADTYSGGLAEEILGAAIRGRRVMISTKAALPASDDPNDYGSSRRHLVAAVDGSLRRLGVERIDLFQLHAPDMNTPVEETLATLDALVRAGKIGYIGASNFSGWHLMKALAASDRHGWARHVAHQVHYSLLHRDYEWELMPLGSDQGVGAVVWSPLCWGQLAGRVRRGQAAPSGSRAAVLGGPGPGENDDERLYRIVDALDSVAAETGATVSQVALAWLLTRATVATLIIGARDEAQLVENIRSVSIVLEPRHRAQLEAASTRPPIYPIWHQRMFPMLDEGQPRAGHGRDESG